MAAAIRTAHHAGHKEKLDRMAADSRLLPKTEKYEAVHYMLNEWDALMNIFTRGDYHLDNNLVERLNRYISLSRRNSLFFGSHTGARRAYERRIN